MWKLLLDQLKENRTPRNSKELAHLHEEPPESYAAQFADIPAPKAPLSPRLLAAQWICGLLLAEDMPSLAADLLEHGLDSPSLRRLAGEINVQSRRDIEGLVGSTFHELSMLYPVSQQYAREIVTVQIAREVIAGQRNVWAASFALDKITDWDWKHQVEDLYTLLYLNEEIDLDCGRPVTEIKKDLIQTFAKLGMQTKRKKRMAVHGSLEGQGWIADDFDGPLPDELQAYFDGRHPDPLLDDPI